MKYKHIVEEKEYKYGPKEKLKTKKQAQEYVETVRRDIVTKIVLEGFFKSVEKVEKEEKKNSIILRFKIKYPSDLF